MAATCCGYKEGKSGCIYQKYKRKLHACSLRIVTRRDFGYFCYSTYACGKHLCMFLSTQIFQTFAVQINIVNSNRLIQIDFPENL